jgi:acetyl-CoA acyltransferase
LREAVIVEAVRSPMGRKKGSLRETSPADLLAEVLDALLKRTGIDAALIDDLLVGCVTQIGEQGSNVGRLAGLTSDLPMEVPAVSLNRMCGSGLQALNWAAQGIMSGMHDIIIAAGTESMTRVPIGTDGGPFSERLLAKYDMVHQGISAEMIADKWQISREKLDQFSCESHRKAAEAQREKRFAREVVPVKGVNREGEAYSFSEDETIRPDTTVERLAALPPVFKEGGVVTAGNSSQITDGAAALLVMSREMAVKLGYRPRARVVTCSLAGVDPTIMLTGPIPATKKLLARTGLKVQDIDIFEINEAFASVVLAWLQELQPDEKRVNPLGGAIALGHPLGCTGARLATTLLHQLEDTGGRYGLISMCIGWGLGIATLLERLPEKGSF